MLGVTNYSQWGDAMEMRTCMWESQAAREHLLRVALDRYALHSWITTCVAGGDGHEEGLDGCGGWTGAGCGGCCGELW